MTTRKATYMAAAILLAAPVTLLARTEGRYHARNIATTHVGANLQVNADILLDSLKLGRNDQVFITPVVYRGETAVGKLQTLLVNGRNMQYVWERGSLPKNLKENYSVAQTVRRENGRMQSVDYVGSIPWENWMYGDGLEVRFCADECGCGTVDDTACAEVARIPSLLTTFTMNPVTETKENADERPIEYHEGRARVQFELDSITLHPEDYLTRTKQWLKNGPELKVIRDSIDYALTDPNVTIDRIDIVGYASPESPYAHNTYLAFGRSKALAEYVQKYLANQYGLTAEKVHYDAVPENWGEFRELVVEDSIPMTATQKKDLLALIDRVIAADDPKVYDEAENILKTDKRFSKLYFNEILPNWYPRLRASKFYIRVQLKPLTTEQLAEQALVTPWLLTLNEFLNVSGIFDPTDPSFARIVDLAVETYPDAPETNINAAISHFKRGDYAKAKEYADRAEALLPKGTVNPHLDNIQGILAVKNGDIEVAKERFRRAAVLPEAIRNLTRLGE